MLHACVVLTCCCIHKLLFWRYIDMCNMPIPHVHAYDMYIHVVSHACGIDMLYACVVMHVLFWHVVVAYMCWIDVTLTCSMSIPHSCGTTCTCVWHHVYIDVVHVVPHACMCTFDMLHVCGLTCMWYGHVAYMCCCMHVLFYHVACSWCHIHVVLMACVFYRYGAVLQGGVWEVPLRQCPTGCGWNRDGEEARHL